jgi:hypothetical protein
MEQRLAHTYAHPSYDDVYDTLKHHRQAQRKAANHPEKGSPPLSRIIKPPRSRIRGWPKSKTAREAALSCVYLAERKGVGTEGKMNPLLTAYTGRSQRFLPRT